MREYGQAWTRVVGEWLERVPPFGQLRSNTRRGMVAGAVLGMLVALLVGLLMGWLRRGWSGALVGGLSSAPVGALLGGLVGAVWGRRRWPQEGKATLEVEMDGNPGHYAPGEQVTGSLCLRAANTLFFRGGQASLVCRGFFSYDQTDEQRPDEPQFVRETHTYLTTDADVMPALVLRRGATMHYPFTFTLPADGLSTHMGHVCSVRWSVHGQVEAPGLDPIEGHHEVTVNALPPSIAVTSEGFQTTVRTQPCQLVLTLAQAVCAEGETVRGRARVDVLQQFGVLEVRAVLLRIEHTPRGRDHRVYISGWDPEAEAYDGHSTPGGHGTTYLWLEDEVTLSGPTSFMPPQTVSLPFEFVLPHQVRPTFATQEGSVIWKVGVLISRQFEPDIRAFHEVLVHTGTTPATDLAGV